MFLTVERNNEHRGMHLVLAKPERARRNTSEVAYNILGLGLAPMSQRVFRQLNSRYGGGLKVTKVRRDGPAATQGIVAGDILVGLHKWETASMDNIAYILDSEEFRRAQPIKFYILRGGETLFGKMRASVIGG